MIRRRHDANALQAVRPASSTLSGGSASRQVVGNIGPKPRSVRTHSKGFACTLDEC